MHCVSCEVILEKELKKIPGIKNCKISHKKGIAEIEYDNNVNKSDIERVIKKCGYELVIEKHHAKKKNKPDYLQIILIAIGIMAFLFILQKIEIMRLLPNFGTRINIFIALFMGIVASLSTCLALTGGIVMSFGAVVDVENGRKNHFIARATPHIYFHLGRIGGFAVLGGILGLIGSKINYSLSFTGYLTIAIAIIMFYIGLQILNIVPNITKLGFHLPKFLSKPIHKLQDSDHHLMPIIIGVLTFFLPCGFTQTMQLAAVTSQNFITGALIMGAFALGTMPVLISIGIGSTYAHKEKMQFFYRFIGVVILFFGLYSFNSGLVLSGSPITIDFWKTGGSAASSTISGNVQTVKMNVDWVFKPTEFKVKKGIPVRWEINGINVSGCSNEIVIPKLNIRKKINVGQNVIEFTPTKEGVLSFSCWMGMINGRFIVTDEKGKVSATTATEASQPMPASACDGSCGGTCNGGAGCGGGCS